MPSTANPIRALIITPGLAPKTCESLTGRMRHPTCRRHNASATAEPVPARRPPPSAAMAHARTPVRQPPTPSVGSAHVHLAWDDDGGVSHAVDGVLDEEFDDLGCDLGTLLRLANGP